MKRWYGFTLILAKAGTLQVEQDEEETTRTQAEEMMLSVEEGEVGLNLNLLFSQDPNHESVSMETR